MAKGKTNDAIRRAKINAERAEWEDKSIKESYLKALDFVERYPKVKKLNLDYFFACARICIASEYLKLPDISLEFGRFIANCYHTNTFGAEVKEKNCLPVYMNTVRECLDITARAGDFDAFCLAMEFYRMPQDAFYFPRRTVLHNLHIVQDLQDLADGELDILAISMPQRTGKSRIGLFFIVFYMMLHIDRQRQTFGVGHDAGLVKTFYDEILAYLTDSETYRVMEIFPNHKIAKTSTEYYTISLDRIKGMPDLAFRSIDGSITGAVEGGLLMYVDDLIKDQTEVINVDLSEKIWSKFNTLVLGRMKQGVPMLYMGTMWGTNCPISRLRKAYSPENMAKLGLNKRCRFNAVSCYDENGESQFNYMFGVGFDTQYFKSLQLTLEETDKPLWYAMYLAEPISRIGRAFEQITFYDDLPEQKPDYVASVVDVATARGGDNWACPIGLFYEDKREVYIDQVVYNNEGTDKTIPQTVKMFLDRRPIKCEVEEKEGTKGSIQTGIGAKLNEMLIKNNFRTHVNWHNASGLRSKKERIMKYSSDILGIKTDFGWTVHFNLERYNKDKEYHAYCNDIMNWSEDDKVQKTQTDDSIDSVAQLLEYCSFRNAGIVNNGVSLRSMGL